MLKIIIKICVVILVMGLYFACNETPDVVQPVIDPNDVANAELLTIFPETNSLNKKISRALVDANSDSILKYIGLDSGLVVNFGRDTAENKPFGIPYTLVGKDEDSVAIKYRSYVSQSDTGPLPIPLDAPIECNAKARVIVVDVYNAMLYELAGARVEDTIWSASSGAKFDLKTGRLRKAGWISADAAGLPIFPCLVRYPEVETGEIDHVIRFTLPIENILAGHVHPARHSIESKKLKYQLPLGAKLRLKEDFDISGFSETNKIILKALKTYGLILADVGKCMRVSGSPSSKWNNADLKELNKVKVSDFEVVKLGKIK